jgi:hypothetical protein
MVSREELRRILWPDGTFVDFDHSLNAAIAKLRQALSDSAESPRYIETVARRGYRFIGSVEVVEAPVAHGNGAVSSKGECAMPADGVSPPAQVRASKKWAPARRQAAIAAILAAAALVGSGWLWGRTKPEPAPATTPLTRYPGYGGHPGV